MEEVFIHCLDDFPVMSQIFDVTIYEGLTDVVPGNEREGVGFHEGMD